MYIRDSKADEIVASHAEIQQAVRGGAVMGVVPGHGAHLLTTMTLMFCWMGSSLGAYGLCGNSRTVVPYFLLASLFVASIVSYFIYQVLRGRAAARTWMYSAAVSLLGFSAMAFAVALVRAHSPAIAISGGGLVASAVAMRCVAGANYALFAAFFRAKRAYSDSVNDELRRLRREAARDGGKNR